VIPHRPAGPGGAPSARSRALLTSRGRAALASSWCRGDGDGDVDPGKGWVAVEARVARVYDPATAHDGYRVLVDRLWPRGISKSAADLDEWCREVAPSASVQQWYGHVPERFPEFRERYRIELATGDAAAAVQRLRQLPRERTLTSLTASRDPATSNAACGIPEVGLSARPAVIGLLQTSGPLRFQSIRRECWTRLSRPNCRDKSSEAGTGGVVKRVGGGGGRRGRTRRCPPPGEPGMIRRWRCGRAFQAGRDRCTTGRWRNESRHRSRHRAATGPTARSRKFSVHK
jgi:uncharacterized protein YeaO (DUF488 family)